MIEPAAINRKAVPHINFELVKHKNGTSLYVSKENGIVKVEWIGVVEVATAGEMILTLMKLMKSGMFHKILMTRDEATKFTDDANQWMRDFLLGNRHKFNYKISRVAGVTPEAFKANIYSHFIKTALQVIFPGMKISNFEFEESAIDWLM